MKPSSEGRFRRSGGRKPGDRKTVAAASRSSRYARRQQEKAEAESSKTENTEALAAGTVRSGSRYQDKQIRDALRTKMREKKEELEETATGKVYGDDEEAVTEAEYLDDEEELAEEDYLDEEDDTPDEAEGAAVKEFAEAAEEPAGTEDAAVGEDAAYTEDAAEAEEHGVAEDVAAAEDLADIEGTVAVEEMAATEAYADEQTAAAEDTAGEKQKFSFPLWWASYRENLKAKKPGAVIGTCAAAAAVGLYIGGAVYFNHHFYPKTDIFGVVCGGATEEELTEVIKDKVARYKLEVAGRDGLSELIAASQIGLEYTEDGGLKKALKEQQSFIWPFKLLGSSRTEAEIGTHFDQEKAEKVIRNLSVMQHANQVEPVDAHIGETATMYEVVPEIEGSTLRTNDAVNAVLEALHNGDTVISLDKEGCYIEPAVRSDDETLNEIVNAKNSILGADITYTFGDEKERVDVKSFLVENEDGSYSFSEEKIWNYVAQMAERHDTFGMTRTFHTSIGTTVELYGGDYGWAINQADTAQLLLEACQNKTVETIEPLYNYSAKSYGADDIGGTYVEICISQQRMWCYQDGYLMVDTPVVTGNPNKKNGTPSGGVWAIDAKMRDYTLVGEDYRTPVSYWMPFNGNVGIHDLVARTAFGGTIYLYAGSHGCVNTPFDAVQQIYSIVSIGTPVIVYD